MRQTDSQEGPRATVAIHNGEAGRVRYGEARTETPRSLPSKGGSKLSTFTQFLPSGMMSCDRALTYYCHAGGAIGPVCLGKGFREDGKIRQ